MHHNRVGIAFFVFFGIIQPIMASETMFVDLDAGLIRTMEADMAVAICLDPKNKGNASIDTLQYLVYTTIVKHAKDKLDTDMIQRERFTQYQQQTPHARVQQIPHAAVQAGQRRTRMARILLTSTTMEAVLQLYFDLPPVYAAPITGDIEKAMRVYQPTDRRQRDSTPISVPVKLLAERAKKWMQLLTTDDMLTAADKVLDRHESASTEMEAKGHE
jgi:hypothetical protein